MALSYNLGYQESISVHLTRRQIFAGKPYLTFPNIWEWLILTLKLMSTLTLHLQAHSSASQEWSLQLHFLRSSTGLFLHQKKKSQQICIFHFGHWPAHRVWSCRDRHDHWSCKICASSVNFHCNFSHNLHRTSRFTHTKCDFALKLLKFYTLSFNKF